MGREFSMESPNVSQEPSGFISGDFGLMTLLAWNNFIHTYKFSDHLWICSCRINK